MSLFCLNRMALTTTSKNAESIKSVSSVSGRLRIGGFSKYCLMWMKARSHSSFHPARLASLRAIKKVFRLSVDREINRPRETNQSVSCCIHFLELEVGDSKIA